MDRRTRHRRPDERRVPTGAAARATRAAAIKLAKGGDPTRSLNLVEAFGISGLSWAQLWLRYVELSGYEPLSTMVDEVSGRATLGAAEHNIIALALNEYFMDLGVGQPVEYW